MAEPRCRVVSKYGHCGRERGHRAALNDRGHEITFDGTVVFRWTPERAGWAEPDGDWLYPPRTHPVPVVLSSSEGKTR